MHEKNAMLRQSVRELIAKFYAKFPNPDREERALRAMRFLLSGDEALPGEAGGWAGGIVYVMGAWRAPGAGMDGGVLMAEMTGIFGVCAKTIRERAKIAKRELDVLPHYTEAEIANILKSGGESSQE